MSDDLLKWLQDWYAAQCDGDWEHEFGIKIRTLDHPGWSVQIDLTETQAAARVLTPVMNERSDYDWLHCEIEGSTFVGHCGPSNLSELLQVFRDLVTEG